MINRINNILMANLPLKLLALFLAISAWWFVARENNMIVSFSVPFEIQNIPKELLLANRIERQVEVRLQGPSYILSSFKPSEFSVTLDLSNGKPGHQTVKFDLKKIQVPAGVRIQGVFPQAVDVVLKRTEPRNIPVSLRWESIYGITKS